VPTDHWVRRYERREEMRASREIRNGPVRIRSGCGFPAGSNEVAAAFEYEGVKAANDNERLRTHG
jgi:hypothetical protein